MTELFLEKEYKKFDFKGSTFRFREPEVEDIPRVAAALEAIGLEEHLDTFKELADGFAAGTTTIMAINQLLKILAENKRIFDAFSHFVAPLIEVKVVQKSTVEIEVYRAMKPEELRRAPMGFLLQFLTIFFL